MEHIRDKLYGLIKDHQHDIVKIRPTNIKGLSLDDSSTAYYMLILTKSFPIEYKRILSSRPACPITDMNKQSMARNAYKTGMIRYIDIWFDEVDKKFFDGDIRYKRVFDTFSMKASLLEGIANYLEKNSVMRE